MSWDSKERREFIRAKFPCEITTEIPGNRLISTQIENISAGGLRVFLNEKLKTSSIVEINIYKIVKKPINCKGKILWVFSRKNPQDKNKLIFDTGIEFFQMKDKDLADIKRLIASIVLRGNHGK